MVETAMLRRTASCLVLTIPLLTACKQAAIEGEHAPAPSASASAGHEKPKPGGAAHAKAKAEPEEHGPSAEKKSFLVPFAWEADHENAFALSRSFFRDMLSDNEIFMRANGAGHFKPFLDKQKPRATVVACSDSRVQSTALDATPENDLFTIRNIGNQFSNAEGSVTYGVHHLKTPVLLILGHTGCGAVKAAMKDHSKESEPLKKELDSLTFERPKGSVDDNQVWRDAVLANVHTQVKDATSKFAHEVEQGELMVVGAVYDFRNDLGQGSGRVAIVNVNGNTDPTKGSAFARAVRMGEAPKKPDALPKTSRVALNVLRAPQ